MRKIYLSNSLKKICLSQCKSFNGVERARNHQIVYTCSKFNISFPIQSIRLIYENNNFQVLS